MIRMIRVTAFAVLACGTLWTSGCARERVTYDNYAMIRQNSTSQAEVVDLFGEPTQKMGNQWMYERPKEHRFVFIDFDDSGRVVRKQWIDAKDAAWEDSRGPGSDASKSERTTIERSAP